MACAVQGVMLLHRFLSGLQQAPRRKQPVDVRRRRHVLESFNGRLAPEGSDGGPWPPTPTPSLPPPPLLQPPPAAGSAAHTAQSGEGVRAGGAAAAPLRSSPTGDMVHFQVDHVFEVQNVGTVLSGTIVRGCIELGATLWWGPQDGGGEFTAVAVRGIHRARVPVSKVRAGQCATVAIEQLLSHETSCDSSGRLARQLPQAVAESPRRVAAVEAGDTTAAPAAKPSTPQLDASRPDSPLAHSRSAGASPMAPRASALGSTSSLLATVAPLSVGLEAAGGSMPTSPPSKAGGSYNGQPPGSNRPPSAEVAASKPLGSSIRLAPTNVDSSEADTPAFGSPAQQRGGIAHAAEGVCRALPHTCSTTRPCALPHVHGQVT